MIWSEFFMKCYTYTYLCIGFIDDSMHVRDGADNDIEGTSFESSSHAHIIQLGNSASGSEVHIY